jgi:hypothetical protein
MTPADKDWWVIIFCIILMTLMLLAAIGYMTGKWEDICAGYAIKCAERS